MRFHKYQGLGNDYIVLDRADLGGADLPAAVVRRICDRHFGVGSDGILVEDATPDGRLALRIFNPDGSEAEKSGNGLRIFARYLWDEGRVGDDFFPVATKGGTVQCQVRDSGEMVFVEMGRASFDSERIPVAGSSREVVDESIDVDGERLRFTGGDRRQSALRRPRRRALTRVGSASGSPARDARAVSQAHQRAVRRGLGSAPHRDRDLGARGGLHAGVGQQQLCRRGSVGSPGLLCGRCDRGHAGRQCWRSASARAMP